MTKFFKHAYWPVLSLIALSIVLYANTLQHGFVLDDEAVIVQNSFVQQGLPGILDIVSHDSYAGYRRVGADQIVLEGGRYRPLSLVVFAVMHEIFGGKAFPYHACAILMYACACSLIYFVLRRMLKDRAYGNEIAWFAALIFSVHPVHTEVVANIKGCDEQLAWLMGLMATYSVLRMFDQKKIMWAFLSGLFFFLACMGKENALVLLALLPLMIYFFRTSSFKAILISWIAPLLAAALYIFIRSMIIDGSPVQSGDPMNNPFLAWNGEQWKPVSTWTKSATILFTSSNYLRLLIFPNPLTHDYYPFHILLKTWAHPVVWLSLILMVALVGYGVITFRRKGIIAYGIWFYLTGLSMVANILFNTGTFMAERFLFMPSLGFALAITVIPVHQWRDKGKNMLIIVLLAVAAVFSILTIMRNPAWKDNETLKRTDVKVSGNSAKLRNDLGTILLTKALQQSDSLSRRQLMEEAYAHLKLAVQFHPTYYDALLAYGASAFYMGEYEESVQAYGRSFNLYQGDPMSATGLLYALQAHGIDVARKGDLEKAITIFEDAWHIRQDTTTAIELSRYYSVLDQMDKSVEWLEKAFRLAPLDATLRRRLEEAKSKVPAQKK